MYMHTVRGRSEILMVMSSFEHAHKFNCDQNFNNKKWGELKVQE